MFNPMSYQNATYTDQLQRNLSMANTYKWMAYEKLGLTHSAYGYTRQIHELRWFEFRTRSILCTDFMELNSYYLRINEVILEVHLCIAQYCQMNNNDANHIYMASNDELDFIQKCKRRSHQSPT